ncbi:MAG: DUF4350 domain-containing protein [Gemmatimonadaceae bacterium]
MTPGPNDRRRRELIVLAAVLLFFVVVAVFTPQQTFSNDGRATTLSADPRGARIAYELGERLGWRVARSLADSIVPDERTVAIVLSPALPFRAKEVHALLEGVRGGGALLYAMSDPTLNDSLHVRIGSAGYEVREDSLQPLSANCQVPAPFSERMITTFQGRQLLLATVRDSAVARSFVDTLLYVHADASERDSSAAQVAAAAIGFPFGRGRVVVLGDVDVFRNDNVRICAWDAAVRVVRLYEYLRDASSGPDRMTLLFDEYHQGHGARPGTTRAIVQYLRATASGKALAHVGLAGAILLLALGPRTLSPRDPERVERRSPLEHVDALARAYWQVHATRTATRRLFRGLRRRTEHRWGGVRRDLPDEAFLAWIDERLPKRSAEIALVRRALAEPMLRKELPRVGDALRGLEHDLLTSPS